MCDGPCANIIVHLDRRASPENLHHEIGGYDRDSKEGRDGHGEVTLLKLFAQTIVEGDDEDSEIDAEEEAYKERSP